ncbi:DUF2268 domain-containing putative Zn-dependent protease [Bacillaceae bacterium W0354]
MFTINQITPEELYRHQDRLEQFLETKLNPLINDQTWMTSWEQIAGRFQLLKFKQLERFNLINLSWDQTSVHSIVEDTLTLANKYIPLENTTVTVVPALPFKWFEKYDSSIWTNGFTLGPNNIIIAVPPSPNEQFLKYMVAHEAHHACPLNPIYKLTLDHFSLAEWYKMEGTAEYFSLSFFDDLRWWKDTFTKDVVDHYKELAKQHLLTTDDSIKSKLCFGDPSQDIPVFAGYSFAYNCVTNYVQQHRITNYLELFDIDAEKLIDAY